MLNVGEVGEQIILLLTRIANALESIDANLSKPNAAPKGNTPLLLAKTMANESAKRWFQNIIRNHLEIQFVEQIEPWMIREFGGTFHEKTYRHIEEIIELAKKQHNGNLDQANEP